MEKALAWFNYFSWRHRLGVVWILKDWYVARGIWFFKPVWLFVPNRIGVFEKTTSDWPMPEFTRYFRYGRQDSWQIDGLDGVNVSTSYVFPSLQFSSYTNHHAKTQTRNMSFAVAASRLTNPFIGEIPKRVETRIKLADVEFTCLSFNDRGSYLACGTQLGDLIVIDMATLAPAIRVRGLHEWEISSVSWIKCGKGRQICTVSGEGRTVRVYCLEQECILTKLTFADNDIFDAQIHPRNASLCLVSLEDNKGIAWPRLYSLEHDENRMIREYKPDGDTHTRSAKLTGVCALFSLHGSLVFVGGMGNSVHVFNTSSGQYLKTYLPDSTKGGKAGWSLRMSLSRNGRALCVMGMAKFISIFDVSSDVYAQDMDCNHLPQECSLEQIQDALRWRAGQILRFKRHVYDVVSNTKWNDVCTSGSTGEYVLAVNSQKDLHELHVWDLTSGRLIEVLKDDCTPKMYGFVSTCVWHPFRALVCTVDGQGQICLWGNQHPASSKKFSTTAASSTEDKTWLAFVPDFVEIEENEIYTGSSSSSNRPEDVDNRSRIVEDEDCEVDVLDMGFLPQSNNSDNEDSDEDEVSIRVAPRRITRGIGYFIPVKPIMPS